MTLVLLNDEETRVFRRAPQGEARREAALRDLDPSYGRLITVTRGLSIPGVGCADILLIDEHGRLVIDQELAA